MSWQGVIRAYQKYLPFDESVNIISLNEGNTPLIRADRLAEIIAPKAGLEAVLKIRRAQSHWFL